MARNLVLTGFSGTGKTVVGRKVADRLQRRWVDMDRDIEAREGLTVREIFSGRGEAYFRERERELCREIASQNDLVVSTGGGTLVDRANCALFSSAAIFVLDASLETILRRLDGTVDRPLLDGNQSEKVSRLYEQRRPIYSRIGLHINTDGLTIEEVAARVLDRFERQPSIIERRVASPGGETQIRIEEGLLARAGDYLARQSEPSRIAVVSNPTVSALYGSTLLSSLRAAGFDPVLVEIGDGEEFKTLETASRLYDQFIDARLERRSPVIALGGGVVGDVAGFVATTYMRGVPFVQFPTTLLAMIDASIGGKVGLDHPRGKNLIGAFKFPQAILVDPGVLRTLSAADLVFGLSEVFKHAIIGDPELFESLGGGMMDGELIARAMRVKIDLVERDPYEENVRAHLNLGHTFGHALETLTGYSLRHGNAVAIGIGIAARLAARTRFCPPETRDVILRRMRELGLGGCVPAGIPEADIRHAMRTDKKVHHGSLRLILPRAIGQVEIVENIGDDEIRAALIESGAGENGDHAE